MAGCYRRYQRSLERANALDFDDMILMAHQLLCKQPDLLEKYQLRWAHVWWMNIRIPTQASMR